MKKKNRKQEKKISVFKVTQLSGRTDVGELAVWFYALPPCREKAFRGGSPRPEV